MLKSILTIASGGIMLGLLGATSIPTEMTPPEEQPWQKHLYKRYERVAAAPLYDAPPEDLSPRGWNMRAQPVSDAQHFEPADVAYVEVSFTRHDKSPAPLFDEAHAIDPLPAGSPQMHNRADPRTDSVGRAAAAAAAAALDVSAALDRMDAGDRS